MASTVGSQATKDKRRGRMTKSYRSYRENYGKGKIESYPNCVSFSKECPQSIEYPKSPPECCRLCPQFIESPFCIKDETKEKERAKELAGLFKHFGKPSQS